MVEEIKIISELKVKANLGNSQFTNEQKASIKKIYEKYFTLTPNQFSSTCNNCYVDAWILINQLNKNQSKLIQMNNCKFKLPQVKEGEMPVMIQMHGSPVIASNHNLTDDIAYSFLAKNKKMINYFSVYPSDWEKGLEEYKKRMASKEKKERKEETRPEVALVVEKTKEDKIKLFKENVDSLSKKELRAMAEENELPKKEWDKLNVDELINYLAEQLHETAVHSE